MTDNNEDFTPVDLGDEGKKTLQKLRQQIRQLEARNSELENVNLDLTSKLQSFGDVQPEQITQLNQQLAQTSQELQQYKNYKGFLDAARSKVDPDYIDLAWENMRGSVVAGDDGLLAGDRPITEGLDKFIEKYPKMAATSVGSGQPRSDSTQQKSKPVVTNSNFVDNLDAIIAGDVVVGT